jgi:hypothetical protein
MRRRVFVKFLVANDIWKRFESLKNAANLFTQPRRNNMTQQYSRFMRWTSRVVMLSMLAMGLPMQSAFAVMVDTNQTVAHELANQDRARINAFMGRADVIAQLQKQGVTANQAKARVYALTDDEAHNIAGKLDQLPAGGDGGILGVLLTVFIVLLITDILGFTKVFPFTHSINNR